MRVLFVGNSYVFFNDLPGLLTSLARAGGVALDAESVVEGGMTLLGHLRNGAAVARIRAGGWDAVVLQEQSTRPLRAPALLRLTARRLAEESRRAGARPILFLTWARRDDGRQQRALDLALAGTAQAIGAGLAPVGPAWQRVLTERPDLVLHAADGSHPAPAGTYLAACVFFAVLTGRSPAGVALRTIQAGDGGPAASLTLPEAVAGYLQDVAWQTVSSAPEPAHWLGPGESAPPEPLPDAALAHDGQDDLEVALVQEVPFLSGLTESQIRTVLGTVARRRVPAGQTLFASGAIGGPAYVALDGVVGITTAAGASSTFDLGRLGQVLTFGVESLRGEPYGSTVTAVTDATVLAIGEADLARLAAREPALVEAIRRKLGMPPSAGRPTPSDR